MTILLILALLLGAPASSAAQTTDDLVKAAKEAKKKRKEPETKALTNKDVKNAKGKLIVLPESKRAAEEETKKADSVAPLAQHDMDYHERLALEEKLAAATAAVSALEKELDALESQYYEENDPDRRDRVIRKEFDETQRKLEQAKAHLNALSPEPRAPSPE